MMRIDGFDDHDGQANFKILDSYPFTNVEKRLFDVC